MPKRFESYRTPECKVGTSMSRHQAYDRRRYEDPKLSVAARFRSSVRWQKARQRKMQQDPICCNPFKVEHHGTQLASGVHHAVPLVESVALGLVEDNLFSVCTSCHNKTERIYRCEPVRAKRLYLTEEKEAYLWREYAYQSDGYKGSIGDTGVGI